MIGFYLLTRCGESGCSFLWSVKASVSSRFGVWFDLTFKMPCSEQLLYISYQLIPKWNCNLSSQNIDLFCRVCSCCPTPTWSAGPPTCGMRTRSQPCPLGLPMNAMMLPRNAWRASATLSCLRCVNLHSSCWDRQKSKPKSWWIQFKSKLAEPKYDFYFLRSCKGLETVRVWESIISTISTTCNGIHSQKNLPTLMVNVSL